MNVLYPAIYQIKGDFELIEVTKDNLETVMEKLQDMGYLVGMSRYNKDTIYYGAYEHEGEDNQIEIGDKVLFNNKEIIFIKDKDNLDKFLIEIID